MSSATERAEQIAARYMTIRAQIESTRSKEVIPAEKAASMVTCEFTSLIGHDVTHAHNAIQQLTEMVEQNTFSPEDMAQLEAMEKQMQTLAEEINHLKKKKTLALHAKDAARRLAKINEDGGVEYARLLSDWTTKTETHKHKANKLVNLETERTQFEKTNNLTLIHAFTDAKAEIDDVLYEEELRTRFIKDGKRDDNDAIYKEIGVCPQFLNETEPTFQAKKQKIQDAYTNAAAALAKNPASE